MDPNHKNLSVLAITHKFYGFSKDLANPGASAEFSINSFLVNLLYQNTQSFKLSKLWRLYLIFEYVFLLSPPFMVSWLSSQLVS